MSVDASAVTRPTTTTHRADPAEPGPGWGWTLPRRFAALAVLATGFVLAGGGNLDPGPVESRLGLAAFETLGPFGQVFGGWDPAIWPGQLAPALAWAWGEGGIPTSATVRWPAAIAGVWIGLILARGVSTTLGGRAGVLAGLCWFGSVALMDRSAGAGIDLMTGLGTVAALDRLLGRGSDFVAGLWAALAFLAGGWPPVAVVVLTTVVLGRAGAGLSWRLLLPPAVAAAAWSAWALKAAPASAWASALTLPLVAGPAWGLVPGVLALGLPWTPFAALCVSPTVRDGWPAVGRARVVGWLQVAGVCLLAGSVVPGLAASARVPALAGLAVAAAAGCERLLGGPSPVGGRARRWFFGWPVVSTLLWAALVVGFGGYLAAAVPYYRSLAVWLILLAGPAAALALRSAARCEPVGAWFSVALLAIFLKLGHVGYYVPEWNYRISQGPWGRAVGQWVPPHWPIYTLHTWNHDFAFATHHPVRQLASPQHLEFQPGAARYVLLLDSEFANWPADAPALTKVAEFADEHGSTRVLARTAGPLPWTVPAPVRANSSLSDRRATDATRLGFLPSGQLAGRAG